MRYSGTNTYKSKGNSGGNTNQDYSKNLAPQSPLVLFDTEKKLEDFPKPEKGPDGKIFGNVIKGTSFEKTVLSVKMFPTKDMLNPPAGKEVTPALLELQKRYQASVEECKETGEEPYVRLNVRMYVSKKDTFNAQRMSYHRLYEEHQTIGKSVLKKDKVGPILNAEGKKEKVVEGQYAVLEGGYLELTKDGDLQFAHTHMTNLCSYTDVLAGNTEIIRGPVMATTGQAKNAQVEVDAYVTLNNDMALLADAPEALAKRVNKILSMRQKNAEAKEVLRTAGVWEAIKTEVIEDEHTDTYRAQKAILDKNPSFNRVVLQFIKNTDDPKVASDTNNRRAIIINLNAEPKKDEEGKPIKTADGKIAEYVEKTPQSILAQIEKEHGEFFEGFKNGEYSVIVFPANYELSTKNPNEKVLPNGEKVPYKAKNTAFLLKDINGEGEAVTVGKGVVFGTVLYKQGLYTTFVPDTRGYPTKYFLEDLVTNATPDVYKEAMTKATIAHEEKLRKHYMSKSESSPGPSM